MQDPCNQSNVTRPTFGMNQGIFHAQEKVREYLAWHHSQSSMSLKHPWHGTGSRALEEVTA